MTLRSFREEDLPAVAALFTASVHGLSATHYDARQRAAWAPDPPDLDAWRDRLAPLTTVVAEIDGVAGLAGFVAFGADGHVAFLFTAPWAARRGVASALLADVEALVRTAGVAAMTTEASLVARSVFARAGFAVVEAQRVERGGVTFARYAMRKPIGPDAPSAVTPGHIRPAQAGHAS